MRGLARIALYVRRLGEDGWLQHTDSRASLLQAVALGKGLIDVLLPVANRAAGVHTCSPLLLDGNVGTLSDNVNSASSYAHNGQSRNKESLGRRG